MTAVALLGMAEQSLFETKVSMKWIGEIYGWIYLNGRRASSSLLAEVGQIASLRLAELGFNPNPNVALYILARLRRLRRQTLPFDSQPALSNHEMVSERVAIVSQFDDWAVGFVLQRNQGVSIERESKVSSPLSPGFVLILIIIRALSVDRRY